MEQADVNAEAQTKATEAAVPCASCTKIKCFKPPKGSDEKQVKEFEKQLEEQQDAINEIPPDKLIGNLNKYAEAGRGPDDASARKEIRDQFLGDRKRELTLEYLKQGKSDAAEAAATEAAREASTLDAIHTPDLGAGGDGTFPLGTAGWVTAQSIDQLDHNGARMVVSMP
ncbi:MULTISPECIES: polymorphic toxin type 15 domain-containing protein [unclassified Phyllobacterium]|uniref:polymorphic toxin type 15 domain-containing protein n=1 Tax=unclassified Phyllobacterium TaxID=2638441 RepID=UPI003012DBFC